MTLDDLERQNRGFYGFFGNFELRHKSQGGATELSLCALLSCVCPSVCLCVCVSLSVSVCLSVTNVQCAAKAIAQNEMLLRV